MSVMKPSVPIVRRNQQGISSLLFTMVMMVIISLIVIGFAQLARRNQNEALNNQLSTQAYYAAESGVNDAVNAITNGAAAVPGDESKCNQFATEHSLDPNLGTDIGYTCLLVDNGPQSELDYKNITTNGSEVIPLIPTGPRLGSVTLTWTTANDTSKPGALSGCTTDGKLPPENDGGSGFYTCPYPMLRVDWVPMASLTDRVTAQSNTSTAFIKPTTSHSSAPAGGPVYAFCDVTSCTYKIAGLSNRGGNGAYVMRISSIYGNPLNVAITASDVGVVKLTGAQAMVDVTGKALNVLRRIQVRVPLGDHAFSDYGAALVSNQSICKRFSAGTGFAYNDESTNQCLDMNVGPGQGGPPSGPPPGPGDPLGH